ncbi:hypothetical protein [Ignavibacterium sp.]|uniref:hypothetical protein n=1 Tax=Ignavibacterium sp. TaxID=2651167 RepID=UPI00307EB013
MKNKLNLFLKNSFLAIAFGFILFFVYSVYSFFNQIKLNTEIIKLNNEFQKINMSGNIINSELEIIKTFLRTKFPEFNNLKNYSNLTFSSDSIKHHKKSIILLFIGECGACFDNEIPIWNEVYQKGSSQNYFMMAINASNQIDLVKKYFYEKSTLFPIVNDNGIFSNFKRYPFVEMITFVVQSNLMIEKVHISWSQNIEHTKKFSNEIL